MKIENPNIKEFESAFLRRTMAYGGPVFEYEMPGGHWDAIKSITKYFGEETIDINNPNSIRKFANSGWIHFGIINNLKVNALAFKDSDKQFVGVFLGTIVFIRDTFFSLFCLPEFLPEIGDSTKETLGLEEFKTYFEKNIEGGVYFEKIPNCPIRKRAADVLTDIALNYIYYHEVSHLVYCHTDYFKNQLGIDELWEYPVDDSPHPKSDIKKSFELEADRFASEYTISWIKMMFDNSRLNDFKFYNPFFIWVTVIECVFKILEPKGTYEENEKGSHPNNFIRILNLMLHNKNYAEEIGLIGSDIPDSQNFLQASIDLQKNIFNKIGYVPKGGTYKENEAKMKEYQALCDKLHVEALSDLSKKRIMKNKELIKSIKIQNQMGKIIIKTIDSIDDVERQNLQNIFSEDDYEIQKVLDDSNLIDGGLILTFVLSSIAGGVIYDVIKAGIMKLYESQPDKQIVITLEDKDFLAQISDKNVFAFEDGKKITFDNMDKLFEYLK